MHEFVAFCTNGIITEIEDFSENSLLQIVQFNFEEHIFITIFSIYTAKSSQSKEREKHRLYINALPNVKICIVYAFRGFIHN